MDWQPYSQEGNLEELDRLGANLSSILHCPVRYCAGVYAKPVFECGCSMIFPRFAVQAAQDTGDWTQIIKHHREK